MSSVSESDANLPEDVDDRLWIRTAACSSPDYLYGNPHTFPGRMEAFCPHRSQDFSVSRGEVVEASAEAELWIDGFLRGNEPPPPDDEDLEPVWRHHVDAFHRTGEWPQPE